VAAYDPSALVTHSVDFRLVAHGPVTLFWNPSLLNEACVWLGDHGYRLVYLDAADWAGPPDMHRDIAFGLGFPDCYGANLHALNDCLRDVAAYEYGDSADSTGLVVVLEQFDAFVRRDGAVAQALLDIFATQARTGLLVGHRMMCLAQSDDPDLRFEPVGGSPVAWNDAEWLDSKRRP
jgi:Barstar (barnase inhibitor)